MIAGRRSVLMFYHLQELCFSLVPPLWELCCSLVQPIDGTRLGKVFRGGGTLRGNVFKSRLLHYFFSLSSIFSLSLSCGFFLDWGWPIVTFYDVENGGERLC